jgi:pantothenate kinase
MEFSFDLSGQQWEVSVSDDEYEEVHQPLLLEFADAATEKGGRYVVFLAGPPGAGKTATAVIWETISGSQASRPLQTLPMDGFHLRNEVLDQTSVRLGDRKVLLREIKGDPLSFDLGGLRRALEALRAGEPMTWPRYDRKVHDPVPAAISVIEEGVVVVEGNYLLLDDGRWADLHALADLTIFIECDEAILRDDKVERLVRGGRTLESARHHYEKVDLRNREKILNQRIPADIILRVETGRRMRRVEPGGTDTGSDVSDR